MKRIFVSAFFLFSLFASAQSSMLNADFWKTTPSVEAVKAEIVKGNSPSEANKGNHDLVSMAINNNAPLETIIYLIEQEGNSVKKNTHDGRTYLHWAANKGNFALVKYLIEKGSDINRTDDKGATPISFAASNGQTNVEIYDTFFKAGNDPKQKFQKDATLLLMSIPYDKDLKLATYLTTKGLSLKDVDANGSNAFDYASRLGNLDILKALLKKGIKPTDKTLIFASEGTRFAANKIDTYKYLVEELKLNPKAVGFNGENVLHNIVKKKDQSDIITYFINKGVDVNQVNKEGNTVFMEAAKGADVATLSMLLPKVKDINAVNILGNSALTEAVSSNTEAVIDYLISNKANAKTVDKAGNTLAYYLFQSYKPAGRNQVDDFDPKLASLTKAGVSLDAINAGGATLYHTAVAKGEMKLLKLLEKTKIDINAKNSEGMTALHKAALTAKDDVILKYLVSKGANKAIMTEFDETAFDLASDNETLKAAKTPLDFLK